MTHSADFNLHNQTLSASPDISYTKPPHYANNEDLYALGRMLRLHLPADYIADVIAPQWDPLANPTPAAFVMPSPDTYGTVVMSTGPAALTDNLAYTTLDKNGKPTDTKAYFTLLFKSDAEKRCRPLDITKAAEFLKWTAKSEGVPADTITDITVCRYYPDEYGTTHAYGVHNMCIRLPFESITQSFTENMPWIGNNLRDYICPEQTSVESLSP